MHYQGIPSNVAKLFLPSSIQLSLISSPLLTHPSPFRKLFFNPEGTSSEAPLEAFIAGQNCRAVLAEGPAAWVGGIQPPGSLHVSGEDGGGRRLCNLALASLKVPPLGQSLGSGLAGGDPPGGLSQTLLLPLRAQQCLSQAGISSAAPLPLGGQAGAGSGASPLQLRGHPARPASMRESVGPALCRLGARPQRPAQGRSQLPAPSKEQAGSWPHSSQWRAI